MGTTTANTGPSAEERIGQALARIERAAQTISQRHGQLEQAARQTLDDIEQLIARAASHG